MLVYISGICFSYMCLKRDNIFMALHSRPPPPHSQSLRWNVDILIFGSDTQNVIGHTKISAKKSSLWQMMHFGRHDLNMAYRAFRKAEVWIRELLRHMPFFFLNNVNI